MKILFCGLGSIGRRHVENLGRNNDFELCAFRKQNTEEDEFVKTHNIRLFDNYDQALQSKPDAVFITNPTGLHIPYALKAAQHKCHLFIEKPLSDDLTDIDRLIRTVKEKRLIAFVGCCLRFHPGLRRIKEMLTENGIGRVLSVRAQAGRYLPDWRPLADYRKSYSASKELGGGVILDLIHELDYLYWFFGEVAEVFAFADKLSGLEIDTEDTAEILLRFRNHIMAEVHLDYLQRVPSRTCRIIGREGTILWDYYKKRVELFRASERRWETFPLSQEYDGNQMYVDETDHFIKCIKGEEEPSMTLTDGARVLEIALAAKESSEKGRPVTVRKP